MLTLKNTTCRKCIDISFFCSIYSTSHEFHLYKWEFVAEFIRFLWIWWTISLVSESEFIFYINKSSNALRYNIKWILCDDLCDKYTWVPYNCCLIIPFRVMDYVWTHDELGDTKNHLVCQRRNYVESTLGRDSGHFPHRPKQKYHAHHCVDAKSQLHSHRHYAIRQEGTCKRRNQNKIQLTCQSNQRPHVWMSQRPKY